MLAWDLPAPITTKAARELIRDGLGRDVTEKLQKSSKKDGFEQIMKAVETLHFEHFQAVHPDMLLPSDETEVNSSTTLQVTVCQKMLIPYLKLA